MEIIAYFSICTIIGIAAKRRFNRSGLGWFFLSMIITPFFSFLLVFALGKLEKK